jgi:hypothetical protein
VGGRPDAIRKSSSWVNARLIAAGYLDPRLQDKEDVVIARASIVVLGLSVGLALPLGGVALAQGGDHDSQIAAFKREDDDRPLLAADDDDPGDDDTRWSRDRTGRSRDRTNSRHSRVSRDRDRSRGDLTRDWTRDGKGGEKRDWSRHHTKDRSRNDTR